VILNPAPADDLPGRPLEGVDVLTPNEPEARLLAGLAPDGGEPVEEVAGSVGAAYHVPTVVVTLGARGCYVHRDGRGERLPCPRVRAVDASGAGDCFNAGVLYALVRDWPVPEALRLGTAVAGYAIAGHQPHYATIEQARELLACPPRVETA
jgi:ribokinase